MFYRVAMTLRLMLADLESGRALSDAAPATPTVPAALGERSAIV